MKRFYWLLAAVLLGGLAWIWIGSKSSGTGTEWVAETKVPETKADSQFTGYVMGSDTAPVEVVEYADFECPICAAWGSVQFPVIKQQLIAAGKLRWRLRDFPLPPTTHLWSRLSAEFSDEQLLDLLLLCGWYHAISFAANAARVPREDGAPRFDSVRNQSRQPGIG